jgi:eukaryotic-like serine/threonine-protein kinase
MAPEAEQGLVGRPGDIYALGVCLFEVLSGRRPFSAQATIFEKTEGPPKLSGLVPGLPPALDALVSSSMSFHPGDRPATAAEFAAALRAACS